MGRRDVRADHLRPGLHACLRDGLHCGPRLGARRATGDRGGWTGQTLADVAASRRLSLQQARRLCVLRRATAPRLARLRVRLEAAALLQRPFPPSARVPSLQAVRPEAQARSRVPRRHGPGQRLAPWRERPAPLPTAFWRRPMALPSPASDQFPFARRPAAAVSRRARAVRWPGACRARRQAYSACVFYASQRRPILSGHD